MTPKEIAQHYEAKVFETVEAAEAAGFVLTETMTPRNTWNKASAAQAIVYKLLAKKRSGDAQEIGLVLENHSVSGCYKGKDEGGRMKAEGGEGTEER
ncbi:MAG: hypothetical protein H7Y30_05810 [Pyrinomonadaceae bacterium]|nr:hypothetical protein [Pyrinomonadaceae bacterium]